MTCPKCQVDMEMVQNEPLGMVWRCGKCMAEISEDFSKPELPTNRIHEDA